MPHTPRPLNKPTDRLWELPVLVKKGACIAVPNSDRPLLLWRGEDRLIPTLAFFHAPIVARLKVNVKQLFLYSSDRMFTPDPGKELGNNSK